MPSSLAHLHTCTYIQDIVHCSVLKVLPRSMYPYAMDQGCVGAEPSFAAIIAQPNAGAILVHSPISKSGLDPSGQDLFKTLCRLAQKHTQHATSSTTHHVRCKARHHSAHHLQHLGLPFAPFPHCTQVSDHSASTNLPSWTLGLPWGHVYCLKAQAHTSC